MSEISDEHDELVTVVSTLLTGFALEQPCGSCDGTGEITETRERTLDELTNQQQQFLYHAMIEREKAKHGMDEEEKRTIQKAQQQAQHGQPPPTPGSPPVGGNTRPM